MVETINSDAAPKALGNYSHATVARNTVYVCGMASRDPKTNKVPGLVLDEQGKRVSYDIVAETRGTLNNLKEILKAAGTDINHVVDIQVFLTDMADFSKYNQAYNEFFKEHKPARTTIAVAGLPGDIAIEIKAIAVRP